MSIASEITRLQNAKSTLKTKLNAKNDEQHQITNETIDEYGDFVDSIQSSNIIGATAEGENLSLTNTKAMPYSDYVVEGKSEQDGEPSPSNPSEIHSVADDVNLFDLKNFLSDRNVSYTENEDGSLTFITSSALYLSPLQFSNEDIIVSMSGILTTLEEMSNAKIEILNSNNTVVGQINLSNSKIENITGSKLRFNMTSNKTITLRNIKLQKGTVVTPYSPYNQGTVTIKQRGKNLFDYNSYTYDKTIQNAYRFIEIKDLKPNTVYVISNYQNLVNSGFSDVYMARDTKYSSIIFANLVGNNNVPINTDETGKLYLCVYASNWTEELWNTFISYFENAQLKERNNTNFLRTISS